MKEVVAGIDIGGTNTIFGIVDRDGIIISEGSIKTRDFPVVDNYVETLGKEIKALVANGDGLLLKGIGIGAPSGNYYRGTIEMAPNLVWKGIVPLADKLRSVTGVPTVLTNDANAAAIGEMMFGAAKGMKDFIILTLGTGLGSGVVIDGKVVYGHTGFAGEIGHTIIVPGGRDCGCGRQGCLETYVSATGIVRTVQWMLSESREPSLLRDIHPVEMTSRQVADAASEGDIVALEAFDYTAEMLAYAIVNAIAFSSPQAIVLFGGLAGAGELLFGPVRKYVDELIQQIFKGTVEILPSAISENNAAVLGAAALAWNEL